jgi:hypothetical protein
MKISSSFWRTYLIEQTDLLWRYCYCCRSVHPPGSYHVIVTSDLIASERLLSEPRTLSLFRICIAGTFSGLLLQKRCQASCIMAVCQSHIRRRPDIRADGRYAAVVSRRRNSRSVRPDTLVPSYLYTYIDFAPFLLVARLDILNLWFARRFKIANQVPFYETIPATL